MLYSTDSSLSPLQLTSVLNHTTSEATQMKAAEEISQKNGSRWQEQWKRKDAGNALFSSM